MSKEKTQLVIVDPEEMKDTIRLVVRSEIETCLLDNRFGPDFKDETWDRKTLAHFLGVSTEKITEMYNRKELPGKKLGREYFFLKSQILGLFKYKKS
jgi:hypothetical protein